MIIMENNNHKVEEENNSSGEEEEFIENQEENKEFKKPTNTEKKILRFGDGKEKLDYKIASCCNPIPGDDVFGFITIEDGIKLHSDNCPNSIRLKTNFSYRTIEAHWINIEDLDFSAILEIKGIDSTGIVNRITKIISNDMSVDMESINFKNTNGFFSGKVDIMVKNKIHIKKLIERLKKIGCPEQIISEVIGLSKKESFYRNAITLDIKSSWLSQI